VESGTARPNEVTDGAGLVDRHKGTGTPCGVPAPPAANWQDAHPPPNGGHEKSADIGDGRLRAFVIRATKPGYRIGGSACRLLADGRVVNIVGMPWIKANSYYRCDSCGTHAGHYWRPHIAACGDCGKAMIWQPIVCEHELVHERFGRNVGEGTAFCGKCRSYFEFVAALHDEIALWPDDKFFRAHGRSPVGSA